MALLRAAAARRSPGTALRCLWVTRTAAGRSAAPLRDPLVRAPPPPPPCLLAVRDTTACRTRPEPDHVANCTSATSSGRTQLMFFGSGSPAHEQRCRRLGRKLQPAVHSTARAHRQKTLCPRRRRNAARPADRNSRRAANRDPTRLPLGGVHPSTTSSSRPRHFTLSQPCPRPARYGASSCLQMMPSRPMPHALSRKSAALPTWWSL